MNCISSFYDGNRPESSDFVVSLEALPIGFEFTWISPLFLIIELRI